MAGRIVIALPLPPATLSPNARVHWATKAAAVKRSRQDAGTAAIAALRALGMEPPRWKQARATVRFYFRQKARRDGDNFLGRLKASFDGFTDAGIVADDSGLWPVLAEEWHWVDKKAPRVEIEVCPPSAMWQAMGEMSAMMMSEYDV